MHFVPGDLYHVYNQGNNKERIFLCGADYMKFLDLIQSLIRPHSEILAYCLMPNHFHLMLFADDRVLDELEQGSIIIDPLTNGFRKLLSGYARIFNEKNNRSGSLFRQKTKAKSLSQDLIITDGGLDNKDYAVGCFEYIHENPVKAGLVLSPEDWAWSSYRDYAGLRNGTMCNKELARLYSLTVEA